jgi:hypothetical protein
MLGVDEHTSPQSTYARVAPEITSNFATNMWHIRALSAHDQLRQPMRHEFRNTPLPGQRNKIRTKSFERFFGAQLAWKVTPQ